MAKERELTADERSAILLEEMRSQFKTVIEGVQQVRKDIGELKHNQENTNQKIDDNSLQIKDITKDIQDIKEQLPPNAISA